MRRLYVGCVLAASGEAKLELKYKTKLSFFPIGQPCATFDLRSAGPIYVRALRVDAILYWGGGGSGAKLMYLPSGPAPVLTGPLFRSCIRLLSVV